MLTISKLSVNFMGQKSKQVTLLHFKGWPDCDIPSSAEELNGFNLMMKYLVNFYNSGQSRVPKALVHCRGGWGRTGTTVTILTRILQRINGTFESITHLNTLLNLRSQRWNLLETTEQYKFSIEACTSAMANGLVSVHQVEESKTNVISRKPFTKPSSNVPQRAAAAAASVGHDDTSEIVEEKKI